MARARSEERRAEILRATLEVIAERGYRGITLGAVAERVGLTQQGLLHYFRTKEALLVAVLEERDQWDTGGGGGGRRGLAAGAADLAGRVQRDASGDRADLLGAAR